MLGARLFAAALFAAFSLAAGGTLRLAFSHTAEMNPLDSSAWIALGLAAEQTGDVHRASEYLLRAEKVDRQYLPAWTAANFFYRHGNDAEFWRAAVQAAAMSYDDPAPLIDLVDHREARAAAALELLGDTPRLERGYLRFLIGQSRWPEAQEVAAKLASRHDPEDGELLASFSDRLIAAGQVEASLQLTNGDFRMRPSGHGFDWRVTAPPGGAYRWEPGRLRFWLASSTPDACPLLDQWAMFAPGKYRLRFQYRTEGLAEPTGLRWVMSQEGIEETTGPALARAAGGDHNADWSFDVKKRGVYQVRFVYVRVLGTLHIEGRVELTSVALEIL
jgi:tetratricopeptide (TPR) repeat protein